MDAKLIIAILEAGLEIGVPALLEGIREFDKDEITAEDIQALRIEIKRPEEY